MGRTVNRRPHLVDTPTSKQVATSYFHQNEWKGICEDKNTFGVDQNTFAECENVYVNRDNFLCNRPGLTLRNLANITGTFLKIQTTKNYIIYYYQINETQSCFRVVDAVSYNDVIVDFISDFYAYELGNKLFIFTEISLFVYDGTLVNGDAYIYVPDVNDNRNLLIENSYKINKIIKYDGANWPNSGYTEIINTPSLQNNLLKINNVNWPYALTDLRYVIAAKTQATTNTDFVIINHMPYYLSIEVGTINNGNINVSIKFNTVFDNQTIIQNKTLAIPITMTTSSTPLIKVRQCSWYKSQGKYYIAGLVASNRELNLFLLAYDIYNDNFTILNYGHSNYMFWLDVLEPIFAINDNSVTVITACMAGVSDYAGVSYAYITQNDFDIGDFKTVDYNTAEDAAYTIADATNYGIFDDNTLIIVNENQHKKITISRTAIDYANIENLGYNSQRDLRNQYFYDFNYSDYSLYRHSYQRKNVVQLNAVFKHFNSINELFSHVNDAFVTGDGEVWLNTYLNGLLTTEKVSLLPAELYNSDDDFEYNFAYSLYAEYTGVVPNLIKPIGNNSFLYFVNDTSYILLVRYNNESIQLYIPEGKENKYYDTVIDAEQTSDKSLAVIGNNVIYSVVDTGEVDDKQLPLLQYIQSKLNLRVIEDSDSIIAYNSSTLLMPTYNGIAAVNYSQLISVEEQTVNYITDNVLSHWFRFIATETGRLKTCNHNYYLLVYHTGRNDLYMFDYRSNTWWYWTFDKNIKLLHTIGLYCFVVFEDNTLHYFDEKVLDAQWSITSQKLFLGNNTNYKQIRRFTVHTVGEKSKDYSYQSGDGDNVMDLQFTNYRKRMYENDDETFNFNVDFVRTYVIRLNYPKVYEFQYKLSSNKINLKPLALTGITIEYKIGGKVR